ncbi:hypothetical protein EON62_00905 [archaeon]|nr:MAG: hypothetical protein EON62_00905 [archaeon]
MLFGETAATISAAKKPRLNGTACTHDARTQCALSHLDAYVRPVFLLQYPVVVQTTMARREMWGTLLLVVLPLRRRTL